VGGLEVDAFTTGVGRDQYLEPASEKPLLHILSGTLVHAAVEDFSAESTIAEQASQPAGGICELGEDKQLVAGGSDLVTCHDLDCRLPLGWLVLGCEGMFKQADYGLDCVQFGPSIPASGFQDGSLGVPPRFVGIKIGSDEIMMVEPVRCDRVYSPRLATRQRNGAAP
jgi:hypothetical protein